MDAWVIIDNLIRFAISPGSYLLSMLIGWKAAVEGLIGLSVVTIIIARR
ncbi:MAG: hypothetical protein H0Z18_08000 [Thermococcus sp.]|nr:hypothetical protein [Thermococcus sp.]MBO8175185.1 hypothetical protein [Thermococcus sp.]